MVKVCPADTSCSEGPPPLMLPETPGSEAKLETVPSSLEIAYLTLESLTLGS